MFNERYQDMRTHLLLFLLSGLTATGTAQEKIFRKNLISFETGVYNRGAIGVSYSRNFCVHDSFFFSADIYAGFGIFGNSFKGVSLAVNPGKNKGRFMTGIDLKYFRYGRDYPFHLAEKTLFFWTITPYIGAVAFTQSPRVFKIKTGAMPIFDPALEAPRWVPVLGFSLGCGF